MKKITMRKRILLLLVSALLLCLWGCGSTTTELNEGQSMVKEYENLHETPREGGTLKLALTGAKSLNPLQADNQNNLYILKLIFDGLFQVKPDKTVEPVLCDTYSVSADGLTYTFRIRDGISFHNGQKLTAADAEASLALLLGSDGVYSGRLTCVASHSSQNMFLTVTLHYPVINFPALLDFPIMSAADMATRADMYVPNGTGRYKVQSYKQSKELYLSVNKNYYRAFNPHISDILVYQLKDAATAVTMLENMQLNLLTSSAVNLYEYTPKRQLSTAEVAGNKFNFVGINNQQAALLSPVTRSALSLAINREDLMKQCTVTYATATELPFPPGSVLSGAHGEAIPYDPEQARTLLTNDGWQDVDGDGVLEKEVYGEETEFTLTILVNQENQIRLKIAEMLKEAFREIGVPATVVSVPFEDYRTQIAERHYDVFVGSVSVADNFDLSFMMKTDENSFGIADEWIDQLLLSAAMQTDEAGKLGLYSELCETIRAKALFAGLYFENEFLVFDQSVKGDITPSATDLFYGIENWFLAKAE